MDWDIPSLRSEKFWKPETLQKCFFPKMWFFGNLGFPSVTLVNKSLKALCLSSKMVYQHLLYTLSLWTCWHLKFTQGPTNFRGCWMADFTTVLSRNSSGLLPCREIHKLCVVISHDFWGYGRVCLFVHSGLAVAENKPNSIPNGTYMQKAGDCGDISPQFFLDFPQNFRLRTRNQYCTQAIAWGSTILDGGSTIHPLWDEQQ